MFQVKKNDPTTCIIVKVNRISLACVVWEVSLVTAWISRASPEKDPIQVGS